MSVPSSITTLSPVPGSNPPAGTDPIGTSLAPYIEAGFGFIAQLRDGTGLNQTVNLNMNNFKITGLANGVASTDAVNYGQLNNYVPIGTVMMWSGVTANVSNAWGPNWKLCDGNNGTPNLMDKFIVGQGNLYSQGATGGATSYTLSIANLPAHNHTTTDNGHNHPGTYQDAHVHQVYDQGHQHPFAYKAGTLPQSGSSNQCWVGDSTGTTYTGYANIAVGAAQPAIHVVNQATGIAINNTGSGTPISITPPYYALCYVIKVA